MVGLPGDSDEISLQSARKTIELHPASVRIHPTLIIRHTHLEALYHQGQYHPLSLEEAVHTCKNMLKLFQARNIPVIRMGLQPTDSMERNIVAGPYHPAFRQLVESALMYDKLEQCCVERDFSSGHLTIFAAPRDASNIRGQKNVNIDKLQQRFGFREVSIIQNTNLKRGEFRLECQSIS